MKELVDGRNGQTSIATMTVPSLHEQARGVLLETPSPTERWQDELFLSRAAIFLTDSLDDAILREQAVRLPLPYLADWCALHLVTTSTNGSTTPFIVCAHRDPSQETRASALWKRTVQVTPSTIPYFTRVLHADERTSPSTLVEVVFDPATGAPVDSIATRILTRVGLVSAIHVPLVAEGRTFGILTFACGTSGRYGPQEMKLAIAYANRVAGMLDRAQRYRQAVEVLRARDIALVEIAHDLKVPAAQLAESAADVHRRLAAHQAPPCDAQALHECTHLESTARSLIAMLDDVTAECILEADAEAALWMQETDLVALVRETVGSYSSMAEGWSLRFDPGELDRVTGYWNPSAIKRILNNLLSNAFAFSRPDNVITLRVWRGEARAQPGAPRREWAYLQVRDQGVGIPARDLPHIFEPFYRGSNVKASAHGAGIGLTSVQSLVRRHGGRVRVASDPGEGACLTVMLPLDRTAPTASSSSSADSRGGSRIRARNPTEIPV